LKKILALFLTISYSFHPIWLETALILESSHILDSLKDESGLAGECKIQPENKTQKEQVQTVLILPLLGVQQ
jgi:hypothetical protein